MASRILYCNLESQEVEFQDIPSTSPLSSVTSLPLALQVFASSHPALVLAFPGSPVKGANMLSAVFVSPQNNQVVYTSASCNFAASGCDAHLDAIVITGHSRYLCYLILDDAGARIERCEQLRDSSSAVFSSLMGDQNTNISIGGAGALGVVYASLIADGEYEVGRFGLGAVMGCANLKGIVLPKGKGERETNARLEAKLLHSRILKKLKREGSNSILDLGNRFGWLPIKNYTLRTDPRIAHLNGYATSRLSTNFAKGCQGCVIACRRVDKAGLVVPRFDDSMQLGANLGFFSPDKVETLLLACRDEGLDPVEMGSLLSSFRFLQHSDYTLPQLYLADVDEIVRIIHLVGERKGVGERFSTGLAPFDFTVHLSGSVVTPFDLRGSDVEALFERVGEGVPAYADLYLGLGRTMSVKARSVLAFYLEVASHALISFGFSPLLMVPYWESLPRILLRNVSFIRYAGEHFTLPGFQAKELLERGVMSLYRYSSLHGKTSAIPEVFQTNPVSALDDHTLSLGMLVSGYEAEKTRVFSRFPQSEHNDNPEAVSST